MTARPVRKGCPCVVLCACLLLAGTFFAQVALSQEDRKAAIRKEWGFLIEKFPATYPDIFRVIEEHYPNAMQALLDLGDQALAQKKWERAKYWFDICQAKDKNNIIAQYGLGCAKRERGVEHNPLQRNIEWRFAENHFRKVVSRDSAFRDVFYQWALLTRYKNQYTRAIGLAHTQLSVHPDTYIAQKGIFTLYNALIRSLPPEEVQAWLESHDTDYDRYFLGELYRLQGMFAKADSVYERLLNDSLSITPLPVRMSLVRLYGEMNRPEELQDAYWKAARTLRTPLDRDIFWDDHIFIVNENEYRYFNQPLALPTFLESLKKFWVKRDPLPAAQVNYRLIEHYRRLNFAEKHYYYDGFRLPIYRDDQTRILSFPDYYYANDKLNDMGMIYVRFGSPDREATLIGAPGDSEKLLSGGPPIVRNMSWLYEAGYGRPRLIFHFAQPDRSPPGNWLLVPGFKDARILEKMFDWDMVYFNMAYTGELKYWGEMTNMTSHMVDEALRTDSHSWSPKTGALKFYQDAARFRKTGRTDCVQLAYSIPLSGLRDGRGNADSVWLETGAALYDDRLNLLDKTTRWFRLDAIPDSFVYKGQLIDAFEYELDPGTHNIAVHARLENGRKLNGVRYTYPPDSSREVLCSSSLRLAYDISCKDSSGLRDREHLKIIPNPSGIFGLSEPFFVYYEIYNLRFDSYGRTMYSLEFSLAAGQEKNFFRKMGRLFGGRSGRMISTAVKQSGAESTVKEYMNFDLSKAGPGVYTLRLKVTDHVSGEETLTSAEFELR